jgi:hypothetical protein
LVDAVQKEIAENTKNRTFECQANRG